MLIRSDRRRTLLRLIATGTVIAGLAGCGNSSFYSYDAPNSVAVADFNGDGKLDIAIAGAYINQISTSESPGYVSVMDQNPNSPGNFLGPANYQTDGNPAAMAEGPITGPGYADLAVANYNKGTISVLLQTAPGSGTFKPQESVPTGGYPNDVALCDVNGDGHLDMVVADGNTSGGNFIVILQNPSSPGQFESPITVAPAPTYTAGGALFPNGGFGIACGNLNGDGHSEDVVMTSVYQNVNTGETDGSSGTVSIFFHDPSHPGGFLPPVNVSIQGVLHRVAIADVNHDGKLDIIVANEGPGTDTIGTAGVDVLLQNTPPGSATPTFAAPVAYPSDTAESIAIGDLNGDGLPDIVIATGGGGGGYGYGGYGYGGLGGGYGGYGGYGGFGGGYGGDAIDVLLNDPSSPGTFGTPTAYYGFGNPSSVAIADFNNDGLPDIATADGTGAVLYLQQAGSPGTFQQGVVVQ